MQHIRGAFLQSTAIDGRRPQKRCAKAGAAGGGPAGANALVGPHMRPPLHCPTPWHTQLCISCVRRVVKRSYGLFSKAAASLSSFEHSRRPSPILSGCTVWNALHPLLIPCVDNTVYRARGVQKAASHLWLRQTQHANALAAGLQDLVCDALHEDHDPLSKAGLRWLLTVCAPRQGGFVCFVYVTLSLYERR